jgi:WXG100 family type VII secretion target
MNQEITRVDYETLEEIANRFRQQADEIQEVVWNVKNCVEQLRGGGWLGRGATAFYEEMDLAIIPALHRLVDALEEARLVTRRIGDWFEAAEEEAARPFT